jgi:hypothetical protein
VSGDFIIDHGYRRVIIPEHIMADLPWTRHATWSWSEDGNIMLAFVTNEPTVEAIASKGHDVVANFAALMLPDDTHTFARRLLKYVEEGPPA